MTDLRHSTIWRLKVNSRSSSTLLPLASDFSQLTSPPTQKARSPVPVSTITPTLLSLAALSNSTCIS